jgi:hypothetical protein
MTRPIVLQKTSAAKAEGRLLKIFGIGLLCLASVIVWDICAFIHSRCVYESEHLTYLNFLQGKWF